MNYFEDEFDQEWEEMRAEAHNYMKEKEERVIKAWLEKIGFKEPVGYYRDALNKVMEIYTTRPGVLIGKQGKDVNEFKEMLSAEFYGEWKVKFIEIRGGFVQGEANSI